MPAIEVSGPPRLEGTIGQRWPSTVLRYDPLRANQQPSPSGRCPSVHAHTRPCCGQAEFDEFCVAAPGEPLFQAAAANLNPWTEAKFDAKNPTDGPMLIIAGGKEHTVPVSVSKASFKREQDNPGMTEFIELRGPGTRDGDRRQLAGGRRRSH